MNDLGTTDASGQPLRDDPVANDEKRTKSGTSVGEWLVNVADDVVVPMTTAEVVEGVRASKLSERSLVWRIGMHDWSALLDVPQLRMATGAGAPEPAPALIVAKPGLSVEPDAQRRRNSLPAAFPAVRDRASIREPAGLGTAVPRPTSMSAPRPNAPPRPSPPPKPVKPTSTAPKTDDSGALAVYERPSASLTFSDSVRAEWQGNARLVQQRPAMPPGPASSASEPSSPSSVIPASAPSSPIPLVTRRMTPVPATPTRLSHGPSRAPSTLAPTTAEAENALHTLSADLWGDPSIVLASELREISATSKRKVLWAALGSAAVASAFTVWLVRSPGASSNTSAHATQPVSALIPAASASESPVPHPPAVTVPQATPTVVAQSVPAAPHPMPKPVAARPAATRTRPSAPPAAPSGDQLDSAPGSRIEPTPAKIDSIAYGWPAAAQASAPPSTSASAASSRTERAKAEPSAQP